MVQRAISDRRWNLFARELEDILIEHGYKLGDLFHVGIYPQKIQRLRDSLKTPKFHLLNPDELERVMTYFQMSGNEQLRIRAAVLATAVEQTLMDRIDAENALLAAQEIFPILVKALQERIENNMGMAATRKDNAMYEMECLESIDDLLEPALEKLDQGMMALHLSRHAESPDERVANVRKAHYGFTAARMELEAAADQDEELRLNDSWKMWYQEAAQWQETASEQLSYYQI
jgi:hypothetical protein